MIPIPFLASVLLLCHAWSIYFTYKYSMSVLAENRKERRSMVAGSSREQHGPLMGLDLYRGIQYT